MLEVLSCLLLGSPDDLLELTLYRAQELRELLSELDYKNDSYYENKKGFFSKVKDLFKSAGFQAAAMKAAAFVLHCAGLQKSRFANMRQTQVFIVSAVCF